jgi:hypothetical protein
MGVEPKVGVQPEKKLVELVQKRIDLLSEAAKREQAVANVYQLLMGQSDIVLESEGYTYSIHGLLDTKPCPVRFTIESTRLPRIDDKETTFSIGDAESGWLVPLAVANAAFLNVVYEILEPHAQKLYRYTKARRRCNKCKEVLEMEYGIFLANGSNIIIYIVEQTPRNCKCKKVEHQL